MEDLVSLRARHRAALVPAVALLVTLFATPTTAIDPATPELDPRPNLEAPGPMGGGAVDAVNPGEIVVPGFSEQVIFSGLTQPTAVDFAADGRVFVGLKEGKIVVFDDVDDPTPTTWVQFQTNVHDFWDRGLLGMALDPNFTANGRIYVAYTYNAPPGETAPRWNDGQCPNPPGSTTDGCVVQGRLAAFTNGGAEQVLITDWCTQFPSHSMGDIVFDTEGALIVTSGDGASFNTTDYGQLGGSLTDTPTPKNPCGDPPSGVGGTQSIPTAEGGALRSQDLRSTGDPLGLSGSVIRVDKMTGDPMPDNPMIGAASVNQQRMIAYGLRNPFRLTIHPGTGELWLGDVGWSTWEEINRHGDPEAAVKNYGWPCREGASLQPGSYGQLNLCSSLASWSTPTFAYNHASSTVSGDGCGGTNGGSISGLAFYPGGSYPAEYDGALFFSDYTRDCLWVIPADGTGGVSTSSRFHFAHLEDPVQLAIGTGNDLYYVDLGSGTGDGTVRRIIYTGGNQVPVASASASPTSGNAPLAVSLSASGSSDPDGDILTYAWDFGEDGSGLFDDATGVNTSNTYDAPGTYQARVRVTDPDGASDVDSVTINAGNQPPTATITAPSSSLTWSVGDQIAFSGNATDPNGTIPAANYSWQLAMQHCPGACHEHVIGTWSGVKSGTFDAPDHEYPSYLVLRLHVTDPHGGEDDVEVALQPKTVTVNVASSPAGVALTSGWVTNVAPYSMTAIRGSRLEVTAPAGATISGYPYTWSSWSDGGGRSHQITVWTSTTLTATYTGGFADVPASSPYYADIGWLVSEGITTGCGGGRFCPTQAVTRAQMASFLVRAFDLPPTTTDHFTDDDTSIHEADINALAEAGITTGCGGGRFCPTSPVSRAQMASFLVRAAGLDPSTTDHFTDDDTSIHEADINALAEAGITTGCGPGRFCPTQAVLREQMAAFLRRTLE